MHIRTTAALVAALTALSACTEEQQRSTDAVFAAFGAGPPPDYSAGSQTVATIIEADTLRRLDGSGSMGEEIWTGPGCSAKFRVRICQ